MSFSFRSCPKKKKSPSVRSANKTITISDSIPNDLILEILSRLPAKSVARFCCVSKQWASIFGLPYFTELFLTKSSTRPRLLFALEKEGVWSFFSLPQRQNSSSSLVVTAEFHMKFPPDHKRIHISRRFSIGYASGLIYLHGMQIKDEHYNEVSVICNPNTGWYMTLPHLRRYRKCYSFFGFDPINKQFKVLFMAYPSGPDRHKILTFGTGKMRWRTIECSLRHEIKSEGICINGVLYYLGDCSDYYHHNQTPGTRLIVCFDIRSEKFNFIYVDCDQLINYKGKLGVIGYDNDTDDATELHLWVLEDLDKQEWTKYAYTLRYDQFFLRKAYGDIYNVNVTATGEIILSMGYNSSIYYFNPERNTLQRVEIQGFGEYRNVYTFVDHIEDLNYVNNPKLLQSRVYVPCGEEEEFDEEEEYDEEEEE